jgi:hypothetical protein
MYSTLKIIFVYRVPSSKHAQHAIGGNSGGANTAHTLTTQISMPTSGINTLLHGDNSNIYFGSSCVNKREYKGYSKNFCCHKNICLFFYTNETFFSNRNFEYA